MSRKRHVAGTHCILAVLAAVVVLAVTASLTAPALPAADTKPYWPGAAWRTATPESQGFDSAELAKVFDFVRENEVDFNSLIIIRNGYKILEAYFYPFRHDLPHDVASVTKSVTSLLTGIAIDRGYIKGVQERVLDFFPKSAPGLTDVRKKSVTIEHLLTMTSGFCRGYRDGEAQPGAMRMSPDSVRFMLELPLVTDPGAAFAYCSIAPHLMSTIITRAAGSNELEFARKHLFGPLGIERVEWPADAQGNSFGWGDLLIRPIDLARIGHLLLSGGLWNGRRIVSEEWIRRSTSAHVRESPSTGYGYFWWLPLANAGMFEGRGRGGQRLTLWPRRNLLVVMTGNGGRDPKDVGDIIGRAFKSDAALPENPAAVAALEKKIREAESAPAAHPLAALPPAAAATSGRTYVLEPNALGLESFSIAFKGTVSAVLRLSSRDTFTGKSSTRVIPLGLDGVYRFSDNSIYGLPLAAKGVWRAGNEFAIILNEPSYDRAFDVRFVFAGKSAEVTISERTGLVEPTTIKALAGK